MSHRRCPCRITRRNIEHHSRSTRRSSRRAHNRTRSSNDTRQPLTFPEQCFQLPSRHTTARRPALRDVPTFTTSRRVGPRGASPRLSATWRSVRRPFCSQTSLVVPIMIHMCVEREREKTPILYKSISLYTHFRSWPFLPDVRRSPAFGRAVDSSGLRAPPWSAAGHLIMHGLSVDVDDQGDFTPSPAARRSAANS